MSGMSESKENWLEITRSVGRVEEAKAKSLSANDSKTG